MQTVCIRMFILYLTVGGVFADVKRCREVAAWSTRKVFVRQSGLSYGLWRSSCAPTEVCYRMLLWGWAACNRQPSTNSKPYQEPYAYYFRHRKFELPHQPFAICRGVGGGVEGGDIVSVPWSVAG